MRALLAAAGVFGLGLAGVDPATLGLAVAAAALIFCLIALYRMVRALGRPAVEFDLERDTTVAAAGAKHLREERRRLLRAINELKFDYEMGKLSEADYKAVRHGYELRAVEVMRDLDDAAELHPELRRELQARGLSMPPATDSRRDEGRFARVPPASGGRVEGDVDAPTPERADEGKTRACAACKGQNDRDAKFCKHCGKELAA
jgi:hypothetical protein